MLAKKNKSSRNEIVVYRASHSFSHFYWVTQAKRKCVKYATTHNARKQASKFKWNCLTVFKIKAKGFDERGYCFAYHKSYDSLPCYPTVMNTSPAHPLTNAAVIRRLHHHRVPKSTGLPTADPLSLSQKFNNSRKTSLHIAYELPTIAQRGYRCYFSVHFDFFKSNSNIFYFHHELISTSEMSMDR